MKLKAKHYRSKALRAVYEVVKDIADAYPKGSTIDLGAIKLACLNRKGLNRLHDMEAAANERADKARRAVK